MDEHKHLVQQFVDSVCNKANTKLLSKEKYEEVVNCLSNSSVSVSAKFRWWIKSKGFQLVNFPELNLIDVLCVPAKIENDNDPTILGKWRIQTHSGNIADMVQRIHWAETNHVGYKKLLAKVQSRYEGVPRCVVQELCRTCPVCLTSVRQTNIAELKPILSSGFLTRVQIDLIDMRHKPDADYNYIAHFMDHWSKYHVIWPLKRKTADEVASGLNEKVFPYLGLPRILHSDNGREFVNKVIRELVKDWGGEHDVLFVNGRPRHSQSQGLVEQGNATIERHIANKRATLGLTGDSSYPWASWLPKIQYNMNTEVAEGIKKMPYEVVFGQPPRSTIFPDARVDGCVVNEEDLNFSLNPDSDNSAQGERKSETTEIDHTCREPEPEPEIEPQRTEMIQRPTPQPRKRKLNSTVPPVHATPDQKTEQPTVLETSDSVTSEVSERDVVLFDVPEVLIKHQDVNEHSEIAHMAESESTGTELEQLISASRDVTDENIADNEIENVASTVPDVTHENVSKHAKIRQETEENYRKNAESMKLKYSKRQRVTFNIFSVGDTVTVKVPKIDRSSTDKPRLRAKILEVRGDIYKIQSEHGVLQNWYRASDLMSFEQTYDFQCTNIKLISLREASRIENQNKITRKKCMCKGRCLKSCFCVKNSMTCSSHCHPSKTCCNIEGDTLHIQKEDRKQLNDGMVLTDKHIWAAQHMLKKQFPEISGLKDTVTVGSVEGTNTPYVQIIHVNDNHWLTLASTNIKGPVELYDSKTKGNISTQFAVTIRKYHGKNVEINLMNVQQQEGITDCGLFAIANATSISFGDDPTSIVYSQDLMRDHFLACVDEKKMTPFPHTISRCRKRVKFTKTN